MTDTFTLSRWDLSPLFTASDAPEMQSAFADLERLTGEIEALRPTLDAEMEASELLAVLQGVEALDRTAKRIYAYAGLSFAANTQEQAAMTFMAQVQQRLAALSNRTLFFELWWKNLPAPHAERLLAEAGGYRHYLADLRRQRPFTLSEPEEKIINLKNVTGSAALRSLYDTVTNRYSFTLEVEGEKRSLTRGELIPYQRGSNAALREAAYQEMLRVYATDSNVLGQLYQHIVRDWYNENITLRGHAAPLAARNMFNDIPDDVVDTLLDVCQKNVGIFQRFFKLKARLVGQARLRRYDIFTPVTKSSKKYPFEQAAPMVLDSFERFHPKIGAAARRIFDEKRLDSQVRAGKQGGAFCWPVLPDIAPWVHVNYQGQADDVTTLAHELGHAVHSILAEDLNSLVFFPCLPLAETASTFGEMMLVTRLVAEESDPDVRRDILFRQMDAAYNTIIRQAYFAIFERRAHELVQQGAGPDQISEAYLETLRQQFGDAVEVSDDFRSEWLAVPHIYRTPFYVYAYTFGQLLVLALYRQYQQEGEAFKPRYLALLAAGGSDTPENILQRAGIDMHAAAFWQGGFDVLAEMVAQLEA